MQKHTRINVAYFLFALFMVLIVQQWWAQAQQTEVVPYSQFEQMLAERKFDKVYVSDQRIIGQLKSPQGAKTTIVANIVAPELAKSLAKYDVTYTRIYESTWLKDILSWVLPALVFFGLWYFLIRRMNGFLDHRAGFRGRSVQTAFGANCQAGVA